MAAAPTDWKQITPNHLIPAVEHIRASFDTNDFKYSAVTRTLCCSLLHPENKDPAALAPYHTAFTTYRKIIGRAAEQQFDDLLRIGTPPAVFRAYLDAYQRGLEVEVGNQFNLILQIGLTNAKGLQLLPVEWAKSHLQLLIEKQAYDARMWIRRVCDKQDSSLASGALESFEEAVVWRAWRAPRLIHMHPAGNTPYDAAFAWAWEDEQRSLELLENRSRRLIQFLEIHLGKIVGDAHVHLAQHGVPIVAKPMANAGRQVEPANRGAAPVSLLSKYRSELKRGILIQLTRNPRATDKEICSGLDTDGSVELPARWRVNRGDRSFNMAYLDARLRRRIEIAISKIRADLRKQGLLDRR
jgi:hypothetical protein